MEEKKKKNTIGHSPHANTNIGNVGLDNCCLDQIVLLNINKSF